MLFKIPNGEAVVLRHVTVDSRDEYGNDVAAVTSESVDNCAVWPGDGNGTGGNEQQQARDGVVSGMNVLFPDGTTVTPYDEVVVRGITYKVEGEPAVWKSNLTTATGGVQVFARRVTG